MTEDMGNGTPQKAHPYDYEVRIEARKKNMPGLTAFILRDIVGRFGKKSYCYQSQKTIAYETNYAFTTVNRHIRDLVKRGILINEVEKIQFENGIWDTRRIFKLSLSGLKRTSSWHSRENPKTITHTMQNGSVATITADLSVTITPPPITSKANGFTPKVNGITSKANGFTPEVNDSLLLRQVDFTSKVNAKQKDLLLRQTNKKGLNKKVNKSSLITKKSDDDPSSKISEEEGRQPAMKKDIDEILQEEKKKISDLPKKRSEDDFSILFEDYKMLKKIDRNTFTIFLQPFRSGPELIAKFGSNFDKPLEPWFETQLDNFIFSIQSRFWSKNHEIEGGALRMIKRAARGGFFYGDPFFFDPKTPEREEIERIEGLQYQEDLETEEKNWRDREEKKEREEKALKALEKKYQSYFYRNGYTRGEGELQKAEFQAIKNHLLDLSKKHGFKTKEKLEAYIERHIER